MPGQYSISCPDRIQICPKGISPKQSYSGDGIEKINPTQTGGVWILRHGPQIDNIDPSIHAAQKDISNPQRCCTKMFLFLGGRNGKTRHAKCEVLLAHTLKHPKFEGLIILGSQDVEILSEGEARQFQVRAK